MEWWIRYSELLRSKKRSAEQRTASAPRTIQSWLEEGGGSRLAECTDTEFMLSNLIEKLCDETILNYLASTNLVHKALLKNGYEALQARIMIFLLVGEDVEE